MDFVHLKKLLSKVNALIDQNDSDNISRLEVDLLKSYVRDIYDVISEDFPERSRPASKTTVLNDPTPKITPISVQKEEIPMQVVETTIQEAVKIPFSEDSKSNTVAVEVVEKVEEIIQKKSTQETMMDVYQTSSVRISSEDQYNAIDPEVLNQLFATERISELSDKLASAPISDLTKSMGINERMFTQQELFGNNADRFNTVMRDLNTLSTFDEAKDYLMNNVVNEFGWTKEGKLKKANTFIKLVKRRYI